jgi:hypothetical protein
MKRRQNVYIKTSFFEVMSEVQKNLEDFSAGLGIFFKVINFLAI